MPRPQEHGSCGRGRCYREEGLTSDADVPFEVKLSRGSKCLLVFTLRHHHETLILTQPLTSRDEVTTDGILLEAFKRIDLTVDSSIVEDLRRFLEITLPQCQSMI